MKNEVLEYVKHHDQVFFVELARSLEEFSGDRELLLDGYENIILWVEISTEAINSIGQLVNEDSLYMVPTKRMTYMIDGTGLNLPIVKT
jgi:hypothetical protein